MADPLATVATYWQLEAFAAARSALAAADIETFADDENVISINWLNANAVHGIKLRVAVEERSRRPRRTCATGAFIAGTNHLLVAFPVLAATLLAMLAVSRWRCTECGARW